jgi:hypothetical protein
MEKWRGIDGVMPPSPCLGRPRGDDSRSGNGDKDGNTTEHQSLPSKAFQRMMPAEGGFKPGFIHIRAFMTAGSAMQRLRDLTPFSSHP